MQCIDTMIFINTCRKEKENIKEFDKNIKVGLLNLEVKDNLDIFLLVSLYFFNFNLLLN